MKVITITFYEAVVMEFAEDLIKSKSGNSK